jgi:hypothetical protein
MIQVKNTQKSQNISWKSKRWGARSRIERSTLSYKKGRHTQMEPINAFLPEGYACMLVQAFLPCSVSKVSEKYSPSYSARSSLCILCNESGKVRLRLEVCHQHGSRQSVCICVCMCERVYLCVRQKRDQARDSCCGDITTVEMYP